MLEYFSPDMDKKVDLNLSKETCNRFQKYRDWMDEVQQNRKKMTNTSDGGGGGYGVAASRNYNEPLNLCVRDRKNKYNEN